MGFASIGPLVQMIPDFPSHWPFLALPRRLGCRRQQHLIISMEFRRRAALSRAYAAHPDGVTKGQDRASKTFCL
jgi:hypothetical protein